MSSDPIIGKKLGDYLIVDILGQGGMARVYRGLDKKLNRYAAVKVIDATTIREDEAEYRKRFQAEARAVARLNHPNIVGIYQFDQVDSLYYMAMSFIEGRDLRGSIKTHDRNGTRMNGTEIRNIIRDIGAALDYAHSEGVIHRDIKPSNIMVTSSGKAILTDFGLALSVPEGTIGNTFGSAHYVAPEQAVNSAQAVAQSDIYSLGIVLFEMLTNRVPFDDPSAMAVAMKHLTDPPPPPSRINPSLSPQIDRVVIQALDKDPKKRFNTCAEMLKALEKALGMYDEGNNTTKLPLKTAPLSAPATPDKSADKKVDPRKDTVEAIGIKAPAGFETNVYPPNFAGDGPTVTDSKASAATRKAMLEAWGNQPTPDNQNRTNKRLRQAGLPFLVILIALAGGLLLLSSNSNKVINDAATQSGQSASPVPATDDATRIAAVVTSEIIETTATLTPKAVATKTVTLPDTAVPSTTPLALVVTDTQAALETATLADTAVPTVTAVPVLATATKIVTLATTIPSSEPATASTVIALDTSKPVLLRYDDQVLTLFNQGKTNINIANLTFIQLSSSKIAPNFESQEWAGSNNRAITALQAGDCLQVIRNDRFLSADNTKPNYCDFVQAWRQISTQRLFWVSSVADVAFEVRRGSVLLATCSISAGECSFDPQ